MARGHPGSRRKLAPIPGGFASSSSSSSGRDAWHQLSPSERTQSLAGVILGGEGNDARRGLSIRRKLDFRPGRSLTHLCCFIFNLNLYFSFFFFCFPYLHHDFPWARGGSAAQSWGRESSWKSPPSSCCGSGILTLGFAKGQLFPGKNRGASREMLKEWGVKIRE